MSVETSLLIFTSSGLLNTPLDSFAGYLLNGSQPKIYSEILLIDDSLGHMENYIFEILLPLTSLRFFQIES